MLFCRLSITQVLQRFRPIFYINKMPITMGSSNCKERPRNDNDDFVEGVVCHESDIKENEMKVVDLTENQKVLLVRQGGIISAIGTKCSHYGAPLVNGALGDGRVRCPWHGACFNIKTGDIEDFPGLDSIPCYQVNVEEAGQVRVRARRGDLEKNKRVRPMARRDPANNKTILVVGGGGAGATCVEALRQEGFTGRVVLVCKEPHVPYDRPKLTKAMDQSAEKLALRNMDFYKSFDIEVLLGVEVTSLNTGEKSATLSKGDDIKYDAVFLATGSHPREVHNLPGGDLKNITTLRTSNEANLIATEAKGKRVVILGNSFIGMEVAAYLADKASSVTVVGRSQVPFEAVLGREVGERLCQIFTEAKVTVLGGRTVASFAPNEQDSTSVGAVVLENGEQLPADFCVLGLGTISSTNFLDNTAVNLDQRTSTVIVDKHLESSVSGVYAGGDIAATPLHLNGNELSGISIGHWQVAHYHGKVAAANILSKLENKPELQRDLQTTPFFWTVLFGKSVRYAGYGAGFDDVKIVGDLSGLKFVAYYFKKGSVIAVATLNSDPIAAKFAERLAAKKPALTKNMLDQDNEAWTKEK